jgi:hypothetical protein
MTWDIITTGQNKFAFLLIDLAFPRVYVPLSLQTMHKKVLNTATEGAVIIARCFAPIFVLDYHPLYRHLCVCVEDTVELRDGIASCALDVVVCGGAFAGSTNCPASYTCMNGVGTHISMGA